ncbi:unnamed protein product [Didymodactylos carnosus]|uniref:Uncharacterized protein n=2 Tax=Didymodactylos carnosus TaxID=1234261 RepID=A0A8S2CXD6_9BILA|nr:unnamed protein product [Didymodactylos carnosus]CAF3579481.1 unnamed protein product [Didymodactylos carnosus]
MIRDVTTPILPIPIPLGIGGIGIDRYCCARAEFCSGAADERNFFVATGLLLANNVIERINFVTNGSV